MGDLVKLTASDSLRSSITLIAGPLIRVMGDKAPEVVKSAALETLCDILKKVPTLLKPFLPQLQRTFIKCLSDPASRVRSLGSQCLSLLIVMQTRLDPLVLELVTGIKGSREDPGVRAAILEALFAVLRVSLDSSREINGSNKQASLDALLGVLLDPDSPEQTSKGLPLN